MQRVTSLRSGSCIGHDVCSAGLQACQRGGPKGPHYVQETKRWGLPWTEELSQKSSCGGCDCGVLVLQFTTEIEGDERQTKHCARPGRVQLTVARPLEICVGSAAKLTGVPQHPCSELHRHKHRFDRRHLIRELTTTADCPNESWQLRPGGRAKKMQFLDVHPRPSWGARTCQRSVRDVDQGRFRNRRLLLLPKAPFSVRDLMPKRVVAADHGWQLSIEHRVDQCLDRVLAI